MKFRTNYLAKRAVFIFLKYMRLISKIAAIPYTASIGSAVLNALKVTPGSGRSPMLRNSSTTLMTMYAADNWNISFLDSGSSNFFGPIDSIIRAPVMAKLETCSDTPLIQITSLTRHRYTAINISSNPRYVGDGFCRKFLNILLIITSTKHKRRGLAKLVECAV